MQQPNASESGPKDVKGVCKFVIGLSNLDTRQIYQTSPYGIGWAETRPFARHVWHPACCKRKPIQLYDLPPTF